MATDEELLELWRGGDEDAGRRLLLNYFEGLSRFFNSKVDEGVEDLIQRTMLVCLENTEKLREATSFRAYVYAVARHELYRHLRSRMRDQGKFDANATSLHDIKTSPASMIARREEEQLLLAAMRRLPVDYQVTVELYYWEDLTYAELGDVLGIHRETVKSRLRRAKDLLREHMRNIAASGELLDRTLDRFDDWARSLRNAAVSPDRSR